MQGRFCASMRSMPGHLTLHARPVKAGTTESVTPFGSARAQRREADAGMSTHWGALTLER